MSVSAGPNVVSNGLVFEYDMSNTQRSWKGAPTTNYISSPTEEMARGEFGQYRDLAPVFDTNGLVPYSLSMDIKTNIPGSVYVYMQNGGSTKYGFVSASANCTTQYQRFYFNNITPSISTPTDTAATLATYTGYGSGINPTIKNIQLELGTFATPFVNGTRSNTQAIVDLTGNNTVTANSLTYASDGTFSFNGSGNYADVNNSTLISGNNPYTIDAWYNSIAGSGAIFGNYGSGYTTNSIWLFAGGLYFNTSYYITNYASRIPGKHHICVTRDVTGSIQVYFDGNLDSSYSNATTVSTNQNYRIGADVNGAGEPFNGSIYSVKAYNRALSATEVSQNFNALRGRYGI